MKAQQAYRDANSGVPTKIPNDIFKASNPGEETKDELSIFSGKTHTLTAKSTSSAAAASTANTSSSSNKSRSSSDSPQLVMPDNPSFKGVHPSLVSELNVFNGFIKRQLENAYKAGGEVFGGDEPMAVDGQGSGSGDGGGVHHQEQPTRMHVVGQQQQQEQFQQQQQQQQQVMYQPDYQRQHFDKQEAARRLEREREEAANREVERQEMEKLEMERQELARQQQLHQQREIQRQHQNELLRQQQAQQEIIQQQQLDIRRQQEKQQQQQQMQDQYRQQFEIPQHQLQQRQPPQQPSQYYLQRHPYDHDQPPLLTEPDHGMVTSSVQPAAPPIVTQLRSSQSQRNIRHAYQQRPHQYQPMHHPDAAGVSSYAPPPPAQSVTQRAQQPIRYSAVAQQSQQQHSMYAVPPEYSSPDSIQSGGVSYVSTPTSETYLPPTPTSATSSPSSYIPSWSASSYSLSMPDQQATNTVSGAGSGPVYGWAHTTSRMQTPEYQQHQQYTPEGALRGIAADDRSLQETWQSYMNKVHPTMLFKLFG